MVVKQAKIQKSIKLNHHLCTLYKSFSHPVLSEGRNVCFMEVIGGLLSVLNRAAPGLLGALDEI